MFTTLIDAQTLSRHVANPDWVIVDCRFSLADVAYGRTAYYTAHIPGAAYAHLDEVLSNPPVTDNGRHPLPSPEIMAARFSRLGINNHKQVVAYDDKNGMVAARLWWMLRYMGHTAVAVLDGGWQAWQAAHLPERAGQEQCEPTQFTGSPRTEWLALADEVPNAPLLVDSRAPERYRAEEEPIDPIAGHIPGAVNYFYERNWSEDGRYRPAQQIRHQLETVLDGTPASEATFYCGSGVSACVNLLAMAHAGLGNGRLYAGAWSDWITDPTRPIVDLAGFGIES